MVNITFAKAEHKCWCAICGTGIEKDIQYLEIHAIGYRVNKRINLCPICIKAFSDKLSNEDLEKTQNSKMLRELKNG
jgi:hypothetical protein